MSSAAEILVAAHHVVCIKDKVILAWLRLHKDSRFVSFQYLANAIMPMFEEELRAGSVLKVPV